MLFCSPIYIFLFLPISVIIYFLLNRSKFVVIAKAWLVLASLIFYGYWNIKYIILIAISVFINYAIGSVLVRLDHDSYPTYLNRKILLTVGLSFNLWLLGYFKYFDFLIENINLITNSSIPSQNIILPLAISFFTFQQIAFLVDSYRKLAKEYDFLNYCLFVTFFPQLIAGPIVHHKEMMPQFDRFSSGIVDWNNISTGVLIFILGLFKKLIIADTFAIWANAGFNSKELLSFYEAWGSSLSYTFQIYFDFSGYSDMAVGAALLFNIVLPINFNSPYKAENIQEFWRKWHITLSRWLRDYVYIPLGGNKHGIIQTYINILVTFVLGGIWHGASWTFFIWGMLHGLAYIVLKMWQRAKIQMPHLMGWMLTFLFVNTTWVFFRADSFQGAIKMLKGMAGLNGYKISKEFAELINYITQWSYIFVQGENFKGPVSIVTIEFILLFSVVAFLFPNTYQTTGLLRYNGKLKFHSDTKTAVLAALMFSASVLSFFGNPIETEFLYFNF